MRLFGCNEVAAQWCVHGVNQVCEVISMRRVKADNQFEIILSSVAAGMGCKFGRVLFPESIDEEEVFKKIETFQFQPLKQTNPQLHVSMMRELKHMSHVTCDINLDFDPKAIPGLDFEKLKDLKEFAELASKVSNICHYVQ